MQMQLDMNNLNAFATRFTGIAQDGLSSSRTLLVDCLIAEAIRYAVHDPQLNPDDRSSVHILSVKNWVYRKLRGILPELSNIDRDDIERILRSEQGACLEFLGDILFLGEGRCAPSPTRAIKIADNKYLLISGKPSLCFLSLGLKVSTFGISRYIINTNDEIIKESKISLQSKESYTTSKIMGSPEDFLLFCLKYGTKEQTNALAGTESYIGHISGQYGFSYGHSTTGISLRDYRIRIFRRVESTGRIEYWLRRDSSKGAEVVSIPVESSKQALLAYDALSQKARIATIQRKDNNAIISINFPPPAFTIRWIYAMGGQWLGSKQGRIQWQIPTDALESTTSLFKSTWVQIREG